MVVPKFSRYLVGLLSWDREESFHSVINLPIRKGTDRPDSSTIYRLKIVITKASHTQELLNTIKDKMVKPTGQKMRERKALMNL